MEADNLVKTISVSIGNGTFLPIKTGEDMPGGTPGDPVCAIFFDPGTREMDVDDKGNVDVSLVTVNSGKYLIFTDSVIRAVLNEEKRKVEVHEVAAQLVWCSTREMDASEADEQIEDLLGMTLREAIERRNKEKAQVSAPQPQPQATQA